VELFALEADILPLALDPERFVIFPMIHGEFGEDGQLQTLLESRGFRYCGSNAAASRLCMDKMKVKYRMQALGILTPKFYAYGGQNFTELWEKIGGPFVVKPNDRGSSIGVVKISDESDFRNHGEILRKKTCWVESCKREISIRNWFIESHIAGREISVSILGTKALPAVEVCIGTGFYGTGFFDYDHKYTPGMTEYLVPAPLSPQETQALQTISERIFRECGCRDFGRLDFIFDGKNFYFLEINTIPGMTATSMFPRAAAAQEIPFDDLCLRMLGSALEGD
jgi:D-alanine-D-alanine ligase